ncbi:deoxyribonuclease [Cercopithecine betaherpesvirus 5]|uniref:Deoxyribonuclease n=1 Tax=Simian cytomegalovirus (strain Colburn) TaxID=50292 RepID=G8XTZ4_SCMVC|nr:deoxyribonuclease [Cercopithecine betaherpesvirus 5]
MWDGSGDENEDLVRLLALRDDESLSMFIMNTFLLKQEGFRNLPFSILRLAYAYRLFTRASRAHGLAVAEEFVSAVAALAQDELLCDILSNRYAESRDEIRCSLQRLVQCRDREEMIDEEVSDDYVWLSKLLDLTPNYRQLELYQLLEKESRGQSRNVVWHVLRLDSVSATKVYDAFIFGCPPNSVPQPSRAGASPGIQFGLQHEGVVKTLVEFHVMHGREPVRDGLGLLIDPTSGLIGASIDLCFGVCKSSSGDARSSLRISPCASVYEIKCRYKYLRKKTDPFVQNVLQHADAKAVAKLLLSHPIPGVEFRHDAEVPSAREFLVSHDTLFKATLKRGRPIKPPDALREYIHDLLYLNKTERSEVIVFDAKNLDDTINASLSPTGPVANDAAETDSGSPSSLHDEDTPDLLGQLNLYEVARFSLPAFVNPRHPYYFQLLIQQYVLSQYYIKKHPDPERIDFQDLPSAHLVSAIFRERDESEVGRPLHLGGRVFHCDHIPLLIIVTPVVFDPKFTRHVVSTVVDRWSRDLSRKTNLPVWVPHAANEYVVSSVPRPASP